MRLFWLLAAAIAAAGVDTRVCVAQITAAATIKARVSQAKKPRPAPRVATLSALQAASLTPGPGSSRAQLLTPAGELISLDIEGTVASTSVSLLVAELDAEAALPPIECRRRLPDAAPPRELSQPGQVICDELVIRWPDSDTWPARLSIARSISTDRRYLGEPIPHFTIVAEY